MWLFPVQLIICLVLCCGVYEALKCMGCEVVQQQDWRWPSGLHGNPNQLLLHCAVEGDFLACGSESNEVYVYYKALSKPIAHQTMTASVHGAV